MVDLGYKSSGFHPQTDTSQVEGLFAERFMELVQDCFVPLYKCVSEKFWNNGIYGYVRRPYYMCKFDVGVADYHVPTTVNGEGFPQENCIVVAVLPELDQQKFDDEVRRLSRPLSPCLGFPDSITIFVVAPKPSKEQQRRLAGKPWKEKLNLFLKNRRMGNIFAYPIVNSSPEIAFKKLMDRLVNFWKKRVKGFLDRLKIQPWMYDYNVKNLISNTYKVLENINSQIIYCLKSMVAHLVYFTEGLAEALKAIGRLNMMKARVLDTARRLTEALSLLEPEKREHVLAKLQECLQFTCVGGKPPP